MPSDHASWKKRCKEKCRSSERTCDLHVLARTSRRICRVKLKYLFGSVALHALREVASYSIYAVLCITIYSKAFGVLTFDFLLPTWFAGRNKYKSFRDRKQSSPFILQWYVLDVDEEYSSSPRNGEEWRNGLIDCYSSAQAPTQLRNGSGSLFASQRSIHSLPGLL